MTGGSQSFCRRALEGLLRVLALGLLVLVMALIPPAAALASPQTAPAMDPTTITVPGSASPQGQAQGEVVELLRLGVGAADYPAWLRAEQASWEPWLAQQPGFLGRQLFWDRARQEGTLLIRWASRAQWKAISDQEVARVQERFEALARQFTGQTSGNPFPLLAEAELEPLAASAPATVSLGRTPPERGG